MEKTGIDLLLLVINILNFLVILFMVFKERKRTHSIMAWLLIFGTLPLIGFFIYIFLGKRPNIKQQKKFYLKIKKDTEIAGFLNKNLNKFQQLNLLNQSNITNIIKFNENYNMAPIAINNEVKIYTDISEQFEDMINDILNAKKSVNLQYFIYNKDSTGIRLRDVLAKKAAEGVLIKLIIDDIGSIWADRKFFKPLIENGAEVLRFLGSKWKYFNPNLNYRNHRKLVIIDDQTAYTGGANIGDEYMNKTKLPWRDTHMRVIGDAVVLIQVRFLQDYAYVTNKDILSAHINIPKNDIKNILPMQLISSGPDVETEEIKQTYIKLIYGAKKRIWIQTPYYIPDNSFIDAVTTAIRGGIDVRIMIPEYPDKKLVYYATKSYASDMQKIGGKVYLYPAFIHSKTLVVDEDICSLGTFNIDIRSFKLHFELTNLMYGKKITDQMAGIFMEDVKKSKMMNVNFSKFELMLQGIMRLFSPIF